MEMIVRLNYELQNTNWNYLNRTSRVASTVFDLLFSPTAFDVQVCKCDTFTTITISYMILQSILTMNTGWIKLS